jgi:hypothetical protein
LFDSKNIKFFATPSLGIALDANQLIHLSGDQPGDINLTLLDDSLIIINSVSLGFYLIVLSDSDILKLRDVARKSVKILPATSVTVPSNGANNGRLTS